MIMKKNSLIIAFSMVSTILFGQQKDSDTSYEKKVLDQVEIEFLSSYYEQDGKHGAVGGGLGSEKIQDVTPTLVVNIPIGKNGVLTVDSGISAYTSASSSNINPFYSANSSGEYDDYDDDDDKYEDDDDKSSKGNVPNTYSGASTSGNLTGGPIGTPWYASSGASRKDALTYVSINYSESSEDRNRIVSSNLYVSNEYDYNSLGLGAGIVGLFNQKNTEVGAKVKAFFDQWKPIYPTELHEYGKYGSNFLNSGYFNNVNVLDQSGQNTSTYYPSKFKEWTSSNRNSYTASLDFSQILSQRAHILFNLDFVYQHGMLSTPYHRIYFNDIPKHYIGLSEFIPVYETNQNAGVFRLADDIERLPSSRIKIPFGTRLNIYASDVVAVRTFYRYYYDNWGITSHTASVELPFRISDSFVFTPSARYYSQVEANYFKPYGQHSSKDTFYTSDYDLSGFTSTQFGFGISYKDIFTQFKVLGFGLKNADFRFQHYYRSDGLNAIIYGLSLKFIQN